MPRSYLEGRITNCMIGCSGVDVAANFKYFRWRERGDRVTPQTVANTIAPIGWFQGHRFADAELGLLSEARDAFSSYITYSGDNSVISSGIVIKAVDTSGTTKTLIAHEPIVDNVESGIEDYETTVTVYHLKAKWIDAPA